MVVHGTQFMAAESIEEKYDSKQVSLKYAFFYKKIFLKENKPEKPQNLKKIGLKTPKTLRKC